MYKLFSVIFCYLFSNVISNSFAIDLSPKLRVLTVASKWTDSVDRYVTTGQLNNINVRVVGVTLNSINSEERSIKLNYLKKINLLVNELESDNYKDDDVILFTESHNFLLLGQPDEILKRFKVSQCDILLSADASCQYTKSEFPTKNEKSSTCFYGGGFIGYKSRILNVLNELQTCPDDNQDDQSISHLIYKIIDLNTKHIKLDYKSKLFYNLSETSQIKQLNSKIGIVLKDILLDTKILIIYGEGPNRASLHFYGNQIINWIDEKGDSLVSRNQINLNNLPDENLPTVTLGIFIEKPTPFLEEFFNKIDALEYPKNLINIFIYNYVEYHNKFVSNLITRYSPNYEKIKLINANDQVEPINARRLAIDWVLDKKTDFYMSIQADAQLDNPLTLKRLIEQNRGIVSPMLLAHTNKLWPNFGMDFEHSPGFYDKIQNYLDVLKDKRRGLWNVPFITSVYLIKREIIQDEITRPNFTSNFPDQIGAPADILFSWHNCRNGVYMFLSNQHDYGHLVNLGEFEKTLANGRLNGELYEFFTNRLDWEGRYLHPNYSKSLESATSLTSVQPCTDVFLFPVLTHRFCSDLIGEVEHHGNWSGFTVYEEDDPAPTSDTSLHQIGFGEQWFEFLRTYVQPLQQRVYPSYKSHTFVTDIPFVIRYVPDGRNILNPHLDESTYTVNLPLNFFGKDFEGGGVRFTRYNCSVQGTEPGWLLMHPGKLSHQHHGLVVTKGVRYVLISFIDPPEFLGILKKDQNKKNPNEI